MKCSGLEAMRRSYIPRSTKPMKRSGFAKPSYEDVVASRSTKKPRKRMRTIGPRTKAWRTVWEFLKGRFYEVGRTRCEFGFVPHECWGALYPCHSKKRREMQGDDIYAVAIGCQQIARWLDEDLTHEAMEKTVLRAINEHGGVILP